MILRGYQRRCSDAVMQAWREVVSALVVMPTGTGKTVLFADLIRRSFPRRAMVLAHREELIWQALDKIKRVTGLNCDIEMADHRAAMDGLFGGPAAGGWGNLIRAISGC
jgi:superfamily II DNA or RNA helicase